MLKFTLSFERNPTEKLFPQLKFNLSATAKESQKESQQGQYTYGLLSTSMRLEYKNMPISTDTIYYDDKLRINPQLMEVIIPKKEISFVLTREALDIIESITVKTNILYVTQLYVMQSNSMQANILQTNVVMNLLNDEQVTILKYSQKEWREVLYSIGYQESWIFELKRPDIEGFDKVKKHLDDAYNRLLNKDPTGSMDELKNAWKTFDPLLKTKWEQIAALIDKDSKGEPGKEKKSERIGSIKEGIMDLSNIGPHAEAYRAFPEDAYLEYYQTVSMMSYLSHFLNLKTMDS